MLLEWFCLCERMRAPGVRGRGIEMPACVTEGDMMEEEQTLR